MLTFDWSGYEWLGGQPSSSPAPVHKVILVITHLSLQTAFGGLQSVCIFVVVNYVQYCGGTCVKILLSNASVYDTIIERVLGDIEPTRVAHQFNVASGFVFNSPWQYPKLPFILEGWVQSGSILTLEGFLVNPKKKKPKRRGFGRCTQTLAQVSDSRNTIVIWFSDFPIRCS